MPRVLTVLDFANDRVIVREVPARFHAKQASEIFEALAEPLGCHEPDCNYMVGNTTFDMDESVGE